MTCADPFRAERRKTVTTFRWFLTVLEYSPIGVKFPSTTLYTVKKKKLENVQNFLVLKVGM